MNNQPLSKQVAAAIQCLIIAAIWGGGFVFTKSALESMTPFYFLFFRFGLATLIMLCFVRPKLGKPSKLTIKIFFLVGIPLFLGFGLQTIGLIYTSVGNSAFITSTYVVLVPLLAWLFTRQIAINQIVFSLIALGGLALFSINQQLSINPGDLWTFACAISYALHILALAHFVPQMDSGLLTVYQLAAVTFFSLIGGLIFEPLPNPASYDFSVWSGIIYCAIFPTALAYFGQAYVQKILSVTQVSVLLTTESIFGALFGFLFFEELFSGRQFGGAAILLIAILGSLAYPYWRQKRELKAL